MPAFLTEATQPNGDLVQIGDPYVEQPPSLPRPAEAPLVAVYSAGYVFGRSTWGPNGTFYSLRFGPGRQVHGHNDHMGITYYSRGRNLIVNAGHTGYEVSPYRTYIRSPEAASTLVAPGQYFRASAPTTLLAHSITAGRQYFQGGDYAFGRRRTRSVYVHRGPDFMLVLDRDEGAHTYQQLWHLDPGLTVTRVTVKAAVASAPGTTLTIARIPLPGQVIPAGSTGRHDWPWRGCRAELHDAHAHRRDRPRHPGDHEGGLVHGSRRPLRRGHHHRHDHHPGHREPVHRRHRLGPRVSRRQPEAQARQ